MILEGARLKSKNIEARRTNRCFDAALCAASKGNQVQLRAAKTVCQVALKILAGFTSGIYRRQLLHSVFLLAVASVSMFLCYLIACRSSDLSLGLK